MKIVADRRIPQLEDRIKNYGGSIVLSPLEGNEINRESVKDADALIVRTRTRCDSNLLGGSSVQLVGTATIGTDHIDLPWCNSHGITAVNAPGCNAPAVMQYVASSLLAAGFNPEIHTLGVIGKGHIGSLVVDLFRKAGTRVIVSDPPRKDLGLTDEDYLSYLEIMEQADAVTFHVPYTADGLHPTHHLASGSIPHNIKWLVNASRGGVVDPDLILNSAHRVKFIIDTWHFEDTSDAIDREERQRLVDVSFISTPHIAGYSFEGKERATRSMIEALNREFNLSVSTEGLASYEYSPPSLQRVAASFDPLTLSQQLKASPDNFEKLRNSHLRHEL